MIFSNIEIDYYVRKKVFIILVVSLSSLANLLFSTEVIVSFEKTLYERNEVNLFQIFVLSVIIFSLRLL